jgi:hypothetical protein
MVVVLFCQGSLHAYAVVKEGFEVREPKDLDFIMNEDKTRWMQNLIYFLTKGK